MSEPIFSIPPDHKVHTDMVPLAGAKPWTRPPEVWEPIWASGIDGRGQVAAVLDTGVRSHDLLPKPIEERSFTGEAVDDGNGHGTHCAGSVLGRAGIGGAPAADLVVGKVLSNRGSGSNTAAGLHWVADLVERGVPIGVCSNSWGGGSSVGSSTTEALRRLESLGVWVFFAAGNSGYNGRNTVIAPGISPHNVCVSSITETGAPSGFSSGGPAVDIADGGSQILSCGIRGRSELVFMSGTSMATPTAAGSFVLLRQIMQKLGMDVNMTSRELVQFVTSEKFLKDAGAPGDDPRYGEGIVTMHVVDSWIQKKALELS